MTNNNDGKNPVDVQRHLGDVDYPASKQDLVDEAQQQGADDDVINTLRSLPDQEYNSPTDVTQALGDQM